MTNKAATPQPAPTEGGRAVAPFVIRAIEARIAMGENKYGTTLCTDNGRDPLWDALQEAIDLVFYLCQAIMERGSND